MTRLSRRSFLLLFPAASVAHAIVIRDDLQDSRYRVAAGDFPALVDLPDEGHGTLIAKRWVVTAAHAVRDGRPSEVVIDGKRRTVANSILHPGFAMPAVEMKGDAAPLAATFAQMRDIALLELAAPVGTLTASNSSSDTSPQ